jgi:hypothetical protein
VRLGTHPIFDRQRTAKRRSLCVIAGLLLLVVRYAPEMRAQQRNNNTTNASDLALQNLSRVAATAAEIKAVLVNDPGLMVELKHWIARDATDHGQIVSDSDLTNDAIFGRLEADIQFRSIATALVQQYGFLLPKLNPDSDPGKEHELLFQQRAKWLAQNQEEELKQARQRGIRSPENVGLCDPQLDKDCTASQTRSSNSGGFRPGPQQQEPPSRTAPPEPNSPNLPSGDGTPMLRAQLTQTAEDSTRSFNSLNVSTSESLGSPTMAAGGP